MSALVSLTFDDALDVHLDRAMPMLEARGLRGTFYVNWNSPCLGQRANEWRAAAERGHELGNHTLFHPGVPTKSWSRDANRIDRYTLDRMQMELEVANNALQTLDGQTVRTFAFPCSFPWIGSEGLVRRLLRAMHLDRTRLMGWVDHYGLDLGNTQINYTPAVQATCFAARRGGMPAPWPENYDRYAVPAFPGDEMTREQLLGAVEETIQRNQWGVFEFHGVGEGHHLSVPLGAFESLLDRIATDSRVTVLPFRDMALRVWGESNSKSGATAAIRKLEGAPQ